MRLLWLIQALIAQALLPLVKDNAELDLLLNNVIMSGWVLFHDAEGMLPPDKLEQVLMIGRFILMFIILVVSSEMIDIVKGVMNVE